jgi:capsular polysaccharide biosynthesis protein
MLVARYGDGTWGHWLAELLPRAALAEHFFPGRFRYAVPARIFQHNANDLFAIRAWESLLAYGVDEERCIAIQQGKSYAFEGLHCITPVWSDNVVHPSVAAIMRDIIELPRSSSVPKRIAMLRADSRRQMSNVEDVRNALSDRQFFLCDIARLPFVQQAAVFHEAETLFSVLGSALTGLMYSGRNVGVVAVSPEPFLDRFFFGLTQCRAGRFAEVVGPIVEEDGVLVRDSSFNVPVQNLLHALDAVGVQYQ